MCPDCFEEYTYIKRGLKIEPENEMYIYGTKIEGPVTKKFLTEIKKLIKSDKAFCEMGSQNPPLFKILWECKSAEDAIKHGYNAHTWYRCKLVGRTIVRMEYLCRDIDILVGSLKDEDEPPVKRTKKQLKALDKVLENL